MLGKARLMLAFFSVAAGRESQSRDCTLSYPYHRYVIGTASIRDGRLIPIRYDANCAYAPDTLRCRSAWSVGPPRDRIPVLRTLQLHSDRTHRHTRRSRHPANVLGRKRAARLRGATA